MAKGSISKDLYGFEAINQMFAFSFEQLSREAPKQHYFMNTVVNGFIGPPFKWQVPSMGIKL
jgi:hypothetical protein